MTLDAKIISLVRNHEPLLINMYVVAPVARYEAEEMLKEFGYVYKNELEIIEHESNKNTFAEVYLASDIQMARLGPIKASEVSEINFGGYNQYDRDNRESYIDHLLSFLETLSEKGILFHIYERNQSDSLKENTVLYPAA